MKMPMKQLLIVTSVAALAAALPALAAVKIDMKAGLWENQFSMTGDGAAQMQQLQSAQMQEAMAQMKAQLAAMPPEQRKQMEAMLGQSGMKISEDGINFKNDQVEISNKGTKVKSCVTQEEIDRGELPESDEGDNCTSTLTQVNSKRFKSTQVCTGDNPSRSEMDVVFDSPKRYTGTGVMTQTVSGQAHTMTVAMEGTWLDSDCGDIKPVGQSGQ